MRQTIAVVDEDRSMLDEIRGKGIHSTREVNRAHALSRLDRGISEAQIMAVLGMGRTAVCGAPARRICKGVSIWRCSTWRDRVALADTTPTRGAGDCAGLFEPTEFELYARPLSRAEPVICIDEKSLQLIGYSRKPLPMTERACAKHDYEYTRNGTTNLFVAVEPQAGQRSISLRRSVGCRDVLGTRAAAKLLRRVEFNYTSKHASWLNMAEIEIGILSRQCLNRRIAWQQARNGLQRTIEWKFTRQDADQKLSRHYVPKLAC